MNEPDWQPSPNYEQREGGQKPSMILIHYTGTATAAEAAKFYLGQTSDPYVGRISTHYMIDRDGRIAHFVAENMRAWHAGKAFWRGNTDINSASIGIELVNGGHANGYEDFPEEQIVALIELCKDILERHEIAPDMVLGHSDVAPGRKEDPGEKFPWRRLADEGIGLWPGDDGEPVVDAHGALVEYGYDPSVFSHVLLTAFQQHYAQEAFGLGAREADELVRRRLGGLLAKRLAL